MVSKIREYTNIDSTLERQVVFASKYISNLSNSHVLLNNYNNDHLGIVDEEHDDFGTHYQNNDESLETLCFTNLSMTIKTAILVEILKKSCSKDDNYNSFIENGFVIIDEKYNSHEFVKVWNEYYVLSDNNDNGSTNRLIDDRKLYFDDYLYFKGDKFHTLHEKDMRDKTIVSTIGIARIVPRDIDGEFTSMNMSFYKSSDVRSGMTGKNGLDNKPYYSNGCGGLGGAAHYRPARNIHNLKDDSINNINNNHSSNNIEPRTTATITTSTSYELNGLNINTDLVSSDYSHDRTIDKHRKESIIQCRRLVLTAVFVSICVFRMVIAVPVSLGYLCEWGEFTWYKPRARYFVSDFLGIVMASMFTERCYVCLCIFLFLFFLCVLCFAARVSDATYRMRLLFHDFKFNQANLNLLWKQKIDESQLDFWIDRRNTLAIGSSKMTSIVLLTLGVSCLFEFDESLHNILILTLWVQVILFCIVSSLAVSRVGDAHFIRNELFYSNILMIFVATAIATSFNQVVSVFSIFFCLVQQTVQQLSTKLSRLERCGMSQLCK